MANSERYNYLAANLNATELTPILPFILERDGFSVQVSGLLDTGASVSVLPLSIGIKLGAVWERQTIPLNLTGNLGNVPARALLLNAKIDGFAPVLLAFAWAQTDSVPLLLGQINFFAQFNVCFYGSQLAFEITPKT